MPFLVLSRNGETVLRFPLNQERILVGRDAECDLPLDDPGVSRHHCEIHWDGDKFSLTDYSRNGTFISGERVVDTVTLQDGQEIAVGDYRLALTMESGHYEATTVIREHKPTLVLKYEPQQKTLTIERITFQITLPNGQHRTDMADHLPLSFGAASHNSIVISEDAYISREHCRIEGHPDGLHLKDCGSRNGTWWQGSNIQSKLLPERGAFQIGKTVIQYAVEVIRETIEPTFQQRCGEMLGRSKNMQELFALVQRIAPSDATVLVTGESGTGKELLARALHAGSGRSNKAFVALNCGALPASIIESELFGHERGAFTGATTQHRGVFEQAHGGTLFLDEIGEMPLELQTRLLRVLETKTVRRVGGTTDLPVDCRIIVATNRDLAQLVEKKLFREDLYYRLFIIPLMIPPLREHPDDILLLARHFLSARRRPGSSWQLSAEAEARLRTHAWPGNVRELRHTIERALVTSPGPVIEAQHLLFAPTTPAGVEPEARVLRVAEPHSQYGLRDHERSMIEKALWEYDGNVSQAAKALGIARSTLLMRIKKFDINIQAIRAQR